jgi:hypothetical protein
VLLFSTALAIGSIICLILLPLLKLPAEITFTALVFVSSICILSALAAWVSLRAFLPDLGLRPTQRRPHAAKQKDMTVFDIAQLSLNQLAEYYTINKSQATKSFGFSIAAIVIGLVVLITGIWLAYTGQVNGGLATVSAVAGLLIQFIGAANFYIYNKSLVQLNRFYKSLVRTQDTMLAIQICEQIAKPLQDSVKEKLVLRLLDRSDSDGMKVPENQKLTRKNNSAKSTSPKPKSMV